MTDHEELIALVPEKSGLNAVIEACKRCLGYVKTFTTLQGSPPATVMVDDLASVDLEGETAAHRHLPIGKLQVLGSEQRAHISSPPR